ncbi:MAG: hypothetical protein NTU97_01795 [Candidatus Magasanikbacteria bacterium]|nr:hypothetical protein [Candidatus Magasanikbacteria bacterium]
MLYSGLTLERRLVEGWQLPTVFFAVETLYLIYQRIHYKKDFIIILLVLLFANNFFIFIAEFTVYHGTTENRQYYLPKNLYQSYLWLKKEDPDYNKIILSSPLTSLTATFLADKTVFQGHGFETINAELKKNIWLTFINSNADDEKKIEFLKNWKIDYFFWGPYEKIQKPQYRPEEKNYLKQIYQADGVIIYKINNPY